MRKIDIQFPSFIIFSWSLLSQLNKDSLNALIFNTKKSQVNSLYMTSLCVMTKPRPGPITNWKISAILLLPQSATWPWGQHDSGYQALMGAPDNIMFTVITASHYRELSSAQPCILQRA